MCVRERERKKLRHPAGRESDRGVLLNRLFKEIAFDKDLHERKKQWIIWGKSFSSKETANTNVLRWGQPCHIPEIARSVSLECSEVDWHRMGGGGSSSDHAGLYRLYWALRIYSKFYGKALEDYHQGHDICILKSHSDFFLENRWKWCKGGGRETVPGALGKNSGGTCRDFDWSCLSDVSAAKYKFKMTQWTSFSVGSVALQLHMWPHLEIMPKVWIWDVHYCESRVERPFCLPPEGSGTGLIEAIVPLATHHDYFTDTSAVWTHCITTLDDSAYSTAGSCAKVLWLFLGVTWICFHLDAGTNCSPELFMPACPITSSSAQAFRSSRKKCSYFAEGRIKLPQTHIFSRQSQPPPNSQLEVASVERNRKTFPSVFSKSPIKDK